VPARPPVPFNAIPILAPLTPEDRAKLDPLCELRAFEKGAVLFEEGQPALFIHFLFVGRVKIVKAAPDRDLILEILGPGEPVGAVAVYERRPFPASAVALEPSGTISIPEREFFGLIEKHPEITRRLLAGLTMRLMALNRRLADMTGSVEYRTARLFSTLADRLGRSHAGGVFVPLHLSRQEIADLAGTTIETAIRVMSRWQKDGLVETEKDGFLIRQIGALRALAPSE
jgi:CRP/FNR family transcriptional regulator